MRQLRLEKPTMRGTDVMDWQRFLVNQSLLTDVADGIFGPNTAKASRAYQTRVGIRADGVVGPFTLARALEEGLTSTAEPLRAGMDANVSCTQLASNIAVARIKFVVRYYSKLSSKALTPTEARPLSL